MSKKLKLVVHNDPMDRLTVNLHVSVLERLDVYRQFYEESLGGKIEKNYLVEEMLKTVMNEDSDFKAFLKARESTPEVPAKASTASRVEDSARGATPVATTSANRDASDAS